MAIIAKSKITSCFSVMTFWRFVFLILQWVPGANIYYKVDANLGVLFQIQIRQIVTFGPTWKLFWILLSLLFGSSHPEMFYEKGVLKNFNFNFIKKEILPQVFSCNFFEIFNVDSTSTLNISVNTAKSEIINLIGGAMFFYQKIYRAMKILALAPMILKSLKTLPFSLHILNLCSLSLEGMRLSSKTVKVTLLK